MDIRGGLKGKKTYIVVALGVILKLTDLTYSDISFIEFITSPELIQLLELLGIATVRAGIASLRNDSENVKES